MFVKNILSLLRLSLRMENQLMTLSILKQWIADQLLEHIYSCTFLSTFQLGLGSFCRIEAVILNALNVHDEDKYVC